MKNFIFISPNFPTNYWKFCAELKKNGMNVLGIGDCPYDQLMPELRSALNEYYKVSTSPPVSTPRICSRSSISPR